MASIETMYLTDTTCTIRLIGLDSGWQGGDRTIYYYISNNRIIEQTLTTTITGNPYRSNTVEIGGLSPSTEYRVSCVVYDEDGYVLATLSAVTFTTLNEPTGDDTVIVWAGDLSMRQTAYGEKSAIVYLNDLIISGSLIGSSYAITANGWFKASGTIDENVWNNGVIIEFDNFGTFEIGLSVTAPSGAPTRTAYEQYITIEGGDIEIGMRNHVLETSTIGLLSSRYNLNYSSGSFIYDTKIAYVYRYIVTFNTSGRALFYVSSSNYTYMDLSEDTECYTRNDGSGAYLLVVTNSIATDDGYETNCRFSCQVEAGKTYYLWVRCSPYGDNSASAKLVIVPPIPLWDWEENADKSMAYQALTNHGPTTDFKIGVWNELVNKVKYVAEIDPKEGSWLSNDDKGNDYLRPNFTKMNSSDPILYADQFNTLRFNIGARTNAPSTGIENKSPGDPVIGDEFITLTDCLNEWINKIFE